MFDFVRQMDTPTLINTVRKRRKRERNWEREIVRESFNVNKAIFIMKKMCVLPYRKRERENKLLRLLREYLFHHWLMVLISHTLSLFSYSRRHLFTILHPQVSHSILMEHNIFLALKINKHFLIVWWLKLFSYNFPCFLCLFLLCWNSSSFLILVYCLSFQGQ